MKITTSPVTGGKNLILNHIWLMITEMTALYSLLHAMQPHLFLLWILPVLQILPVLRGHQILLCHYLVLHHGDWTLKKKKGGGEKTDNRGWV